MIRYLSLLIVAAMYALLFAFCNVLVWRYQLPIVTGLLLPLVIVALQFWLGPAILEWLLDIWWHDDRLPVRNVQFLDRLCEQHRLPRPKLGVIECALPNAFTFGRTRRDARIVVSHSLLQQLDEDELNAVLAHELGHIVHGDFIVMTAARLVPLMLYQIYIAKRRQKEQSAVAWSAYAAYWVSEFAVLLLSRAREYAADAFAADATGKPGALASALVKICYGLGAAHGELARTAAQGTDEEKAAARKQRNMGAAIGCMGIAQASAGPATALHAADPGTVLLAMKWESVNPWAMVYQTLSTHPLTSRRVAAMNRRLRPEEVVYPVTRQPRQWTGFGVELFLWAAPWLAAAAALASLRPRHYWPLDLSLGLLAAAALLFLLRITFRYAEGFQPALVSDLVTNTKASQMRSLPVQLKGRITGLAAGPHSGCPDLVLEDETGRVYLSYQPFIPFAGLTFAEFKAPRFLNEEVTVDGWLRRGPVPFVELKRVTVAQSETSITTHKRWLQSGLVLAAMVAGYIFLLRAN
jgi:Zn-dependent protease with chaperone function